MGGTSTYGVEQSDGSVIYNIHRDTIFHDNILHQFKNGNKIILMNDDIYYATSIQDYYSETRFNEEDSVVRGLLRLNDILEWRHWGDDGCFTYTRDKK